MQSNIYVALSGQLALMKRLDSVAQNVANLSTPGYRGERISFEEVLSSGADEQTSFASPGRSYISTEGGALDRTGNPLDVAVNGDGWLGVLTPEGLAYTRDGRLRMTPDGELETVGGSKIVDIGGAPVQINPKGGAPSIARDGTIAQDGRTVGTLGLFQIPAGANLTRAGNAAVMPDQPAVPQIDFNQASIAQGFIERSNIEPVLEMTHLISIQRNFDAISNAVTDVEESLSNAIRTLGS